MICHLFFIPVSEDIDSGAVKSFLKEKDICHVSFIPVLEDYDWALIIAPFLERQIILI